MNVAHDTLVAISTKRRNGVPWEQIEIEFGMSHNTARRKLEAAGLPLHKQALPKREETWCRPCLNCGSTEERRKYLFRCKACRFEASEAGIPDSMIGVKNYAG